MAIYWVDPYIEAEIGGIHGTTDTVSKAGSYSAPWSFNDILLSNVSTGNLPGGLTLTNGDEIRLKGLPRASFLQDAGSNWYYNNYYQIQTTTPSSNIMNDHLTGVAGSSWTSANSKNGFVWAFDYAFTDQFAIADSNNDKPLHLFNGQYTTNSSVISAYSGSGITGFMQGPFRDSYPNSGTANGKLYLVNPIYYIDANTAWPSGTTRFLAVQNQIQIKVTDGWTSSTVRDGYTILPFYANFGSFNGSLYFNQTGNNTGGDTLYDMPNTYFICMDDNSNVSRLYYYVNSAMRNHAGTNFTQRIGGLWKSDFGYPTYEYTAYYYSNLNGNGIYDALSCNNVEINYTGGYYAIFSYARYGQGSTARYNNLMSFQQIEMNRSNNSSSHTAKIGNTWQYAGSNGATFSNNSNSSNSLTTTYEFLANATLFTFNNGGGLFAWTHSGPLIINQPIFNVNTSPFLDNAASSSSYGPVFLDQITNNNYGYVDNVEASAAEWYETKSIFHDGRTSTPHSNFQENMALGVLKFNGTDYKTVNPSFQVKTDKFLYSYTGQFNSDTNIHFSSNDYDGIPIGACLSYSHNNQFHYPVLYYNDSTKSNALCFQSNASGNLNSYYKKNIEVPIPAYTTENLSFKAEFETSVDWNKQFRIDLQYVNSSGATTTLQLVNVSSYVSRVVYETTITNANLPQSIKPRHMNAIISFQNSDGVTKKVWVHDISITIAT